MALDVSAAEVDCEGSVIARGNTRVSATAEVKVRGLSPAKADIGAPLAALANTGRLTLVGSSTEVTELAKTSYSATSRVLHES